MTAHDPRFPYRNELAMPVIGIEAEFKAFVDDAEVIPEEYWKTPAGFIEEQLLERTSRSLQLPTGGAVYFDGGVVEVVTPVIEIAPQCTARAVRSLWEQIGYVRDQFDGWEARTGRTVRLQGFSCHINISFELGREERGRKRTIQKLALLLGHLLPLPVIVLAANRRSTGVGVRPRRDRIEITLDFTPDPGLMSAATAFIVGVVREVISWPSYLLADAERRGVPLIDGLELGKHSTRKGWIARAHHFPRDPFRDDLDAPNWRTRDGQMTSMREIVRKTAEMFRESIRYHSDPFSDRLLFSILRGFTPALLDLDDRPSAYEDVGRSTRWGNILPELENFRAMIDDPAKYRRAADVQESLTPPWEGERSDRRRRDRAADRRRHTLRKSPRLARSQYERVFLSLARRKTITVAGQTMTPVAVKGWYHSVFRSRTGEERLLSIDQLLKEWRMER
ncbi:MAG TPA: hypothetical protein VFL80_05260 [Thermoanaerobaculia bacterium]|nr:hypothetical protein [Thermoanaerobaculia bacterium]